jgi:hypothetical protein
MTTIPTTRFSPSPESERDAMADVYMFLLRKATEREKQKAALIVENMDNTAASQDEDITGSESQ